MVTRERPTLEAVARRAGVSRATVSRVVNGSTSVAASIREAVNRAVDELGYVPNQAARSLVTQRTESVALILPETANRVFSDDLFFPAIIRGVGVELEAADKQLVLMMAGSDRSHARVERYAVAGHVDGVMFASMHGADPLPGTLVRLGIPVICSGRPLSLPELSGASVPYVDVDHFGGVCAAVRHLVTAGRRRIATIAGPQDMVAGIDRLAGYRATLEEAGLAQHVAVGDFTRESGIQAMRSLLADDPALDAVFVASDMMAHGALLALRGAGRRVPSDVAVIGFDDFEISRYSDPPLTTVRQPIADMGRTMARQMLGLINGEEGLPDAVVLPTELVVRDSA
ncbi:LacI family DNA-binding transcriptional regulator [Actinoplanes solisilvae]|uniref:LacI family DNA-binding transcriptional regulator n=1 Tax=Actinoplanes solisilvae TaxID=2486853 RepID=UPI000FD7C1E2|nr:LacI family DNA-binding transcriptional regulator [Actinoplanes solisilvae]